MTFKY